MNSIDFETPIFQQLYSLPQLLELPSIRNSVIKYKPKPKLKRLSKN